MKHIHFKEIPSTQDYLINECPYMDEDFLISTSKQTKGRGRGANSWDSHQNALAFSFSMNANDDITFTPLEIAVLLIEYFQQNNEYDLNDSLHTKWPNDILNSSRQKIGGILIQIFQNKAIVGIGLNYGQVVNITDYQKQKMATLTNKSLNEMDYKDIPEQVFNYISNNRKSKNEIVHRWNELCLHLNSEVEIIDGDNQIKGKFLGIGNYGEALVEVEGQQEKVYTGSLYIK